MRVQESAERSHTEVNEGPGVYPVHQHIGPDRQLFPKFQLLGAVSKKATEWPIIYHQAIVFGQRLLEWADNFHAYDPGHALRKHMGGKVPHNGWVWPPAAFLDALLSDQLKFWLALHHPDYHHRNIQQNLRKVHQNKLLPNSSTHKHKRKMVVADRKYLSGSHLHSERNVRITAPLSPSLSLKCGRRTWLILQVVRVALLLGPAPTILNIIHISACSIILKTVVVENDCYSLFKKK